MARSSFCRSATLLGTASSRLCSPSPIRCQGSKFHGFTDDELKRIPILPQGSRLEQGATCVDLQDSQLAEFTATGAMEATPGHWYVPKSEVDYQLWNRLIGITNPERLGDADDS